MYTPTLSKSIALRFVRSIALKDLRSEYARLVGDSHRLLTFYGRPGPGTGEVSLTLVTIAPNGAISAMRAVTDRGEGLFPSFLPDYPAFHVFEREILEEMGLRADGNPWLKPLRFPVGAAAKPEDFPFFKVEGKEVHEVGVGPVHAGVIEPGHFRFMCFGETVHHLEIQLGYQHRGVASLLLKRDPRRLGPLVESVVGDSSVAHATAYSLALEDLSGIGCDASASLVRGIAIELERVAMHLASLAGLAADIAYLPGASTYGRLRTAVINLSMRLCGSRFGRSWIRPGGVQYGVRAEQAQDVISTLSRLKEDALTIDDCMFSSLSVRHRLSGVGRLRHDDARNTGIVGLVARSSGVPIDLRLCPSPDYEPGTRIADPESTSGDCLARSLIRCDEMIQSIDWIIESLRKRTDTGRGQMLQLASFAPETLVVAAVEGWRGEIVHCLETDDAGVVIHYRVQDPSLRNWLGLALAVRGGAISDFPVCNKSFDLSYCGNDL